MGFFVSFRHMFHIKNESDIVSDTVLVQHVVQRKRVADTDVGAGIREQIDDLYILLGMYRSGAI